MTQTVKSTKRKQRLSAVSKREAMMGFLFAAPWILGFVLLQAFPLLYSLYLSFTNATTTSMVVDWKGLNNFKAMGVRTFF